jgi:hypothetical protein
MATYQQKSAERWTGKVDVVESGRAYVSYSFKRSQCRRESEYIKDTLVEDLPSVVIKSWKWIFHKRYLQNHPSQQNLITKDAE